MSTATQQNSRPDWQHAAVQLLQGPIFEHDGERWRRVTQGKSEIDGYFRQIGLHLTVDTTEGYAYLDQLPDEELNGMPRVLRKRQFSMGTTIYGMYLRQELDRAIKDDPAVTRVRRNLKQIRDLVSEYFPATNNETADRRAALGYLSDLLDLGFLKFIKDAGEDGEGEYELSRLLRAKFNPTAAETLIDQIKAQISKRNENTRTNEQPTDAV